MRVLIIGATGFIGRHLMKELANAGHHPVAVSRNFQKARDILGLHAEIAEWDGQSAIMLAEHIAGVEAIVNLAGENLAAGRWTDRRKKKITESRVKTGRLLAEAVMASPLKPKAIIQGSAIGYYGIHVEMPAGEDHPAGTGFIAELTRDWEASVASLDNVVSRVVIIRSGLVLGKNEGIIKRILLPFSFYSGTVIGSGRQWMSWIHIQDEVRAIRFLLEQKSLSGPFNLTAPNPVNMKAFITSSGKAYGKPAWLKVPGLLIKAVFGKMAVETILASQNIYPVKLLKEDFKFEFPFLPGALEDLLTEKKS